MSKEITSKTKRIAQILALLEQGPILVHDLSLRFGVSFRTIQRDIKLLLNTQIPLISSQQSIYEYAEGFSLKAVGLSCEKMALMAVSFDIAKQIGGDFAKIQQEISQYFVPPSFEHCIFGAPADAFAPEDTSSLKVMQAIESRTPVYLYLKDTREVFYGYVLKLLSIWGKWYIATISYCRQEIKYFPIDNIKDIDSSYNKTNFHRKPFIEWAIWKEAHKWALLLMPAQEQDKQTSQNDILIA